MNYTANLDGIQVLDVLMCEDGTKITIISIAAKISAFGRGFRLYPPLDEMCSVKHSESNNNCRKFYKTINPIK